MSLKDDYRRRFDQTLTPIARALEGHIGQYLHDTPRIDRVSGRPKTVKSFLDKANKRSGDGQAKYADPLSQIQDQIGVRIITFYKDDVDVLSGLILKYFRPIEEKDRTPQSEWEFGYFGKHFILLLPTDVIQPEWDRELTPAVFELQIKTLFQHSWSEANHDLGYKPEDTPFLPDEKRLLAYASAQAWGADRIFNDMFRKHEDHRKSVMQRT